MYLTNIILLLSTGASALAAPHLATRQTDDQASVTQVIQNLGFDVAVLGDIIFKLVKQTNPCDFTSIVNDATTALNFRADFETQVGLLNTASGSNFKSDLADPLTMISKSVPGANAQSTFGVALNLSFYWDSTVVPGLEELVSAAEAKNGLRREDRPSSFSPRTIGADATKFQAECKS